MSELNSTERRSMHAIYHGAGRPLLLVHGLGSLATTWDPIIESVKRDRRVIALDLPGFGETPPLPGEVTIASLSDAVQRFIDEEKLGAVDMVGSSMGARMVLELARRGFGGDIVALDPGGFWTSGQQRVFGWSISMSVRLIRRLQPVLPAITRTRAGRTLLLSQFSARPWALPGELVLNELNNFVASPSFDAALDALAHGPLQAGMDAGTARGKMTIVWGKRDRVTLPSQAARALELFPDAQLHWIEDSGHFPHWDQPARTAALILERTG